MEHKLSYEYILYYNHLDQGYNFYDKSQSFPASYRKDLQEICVRIEEPNVAAGNTVALRYSPVQDRYLWSVIFRQPDGDGHQLRGVTTAVNLLMTAEQADEAFRIQPETLLLVIEKEARLLLEKLEIPIITGKEMSISTPGSIPPVQLLNAASYASGDSLSKQAYFVMETPILPEVAAMLNVLPPKLRKHTSFHTGIQSTRESIGIAVSFCTPQMMEDSLRSNLTGGQSNTNKYLYHIYPDGTSDSKQSDKSGIQETSQLLQILQQPPYPELSKPLMIDTIENWAQMDALSSLTDASEPLDVLLKTIPEDTLISFLQTHQLPSDILKGLEKYAKAHRMPKLRSSILGIMPLNPNAKNEAYSQDEYPDTAFEKNSPNRKPRKRRAPNPASNPYQPMLYKALWSGIKLVILILLIWGGALLLKSLLQITSTQQEQTVTLMIELNTAKSLLKILGLTGITAAVSSMITYHITKWNRRKKHKSDKEKQ